MTRTPRTAAVVGGGIGRIATLDLAAMKRRTGEVGRLISRPDLLSLLQEAAGEITFGERIADIHALEGSYDVELGRSLTTTWSWAGP